MPNPAHVNLHDLLTQPLRETATPLWYRSLNPVCPHLLVLRLPDLLAGSRLSGADNLSRRFKVVVVETEEEVLEAERSSTGR